MKIQTALLACCLSQATLALAHNEAYPESEIKSLKVNVELLDLKKGNQFIGQVVIEETPAGLVFTPNLTQLSSSIHGFHLHENANCDPKEKNGKLVAGLGAGGHWDPAKTGKHGFPWASNNHLGDLPPLYVDSKGNAKTPVLAPKLKSLEQIKGHALMIHQYGDNYSDLPKKLGGGGPRMACGVVK